MNRGIERAARDVSLLAGAIFLAALLAGAVVVRAAERAGSLTPTTAVSPLVTARAMSRALAGGHAGEATVTYAVADMGGTPRTITGRLRVESPDRVRLDFTTTGEKITLRSDGGEWLQPATRQMIRIPAERASGALRWWRVLLPGSSASFHEDSVGDRRYRLTSRDVPGGITVTVRLDARGFPAELTVEGMQDEPVTYRLSGWRFGAGQGEASYHLTAPAGYETVDLP
jgi:hypothetical protein